MPLLGGRDQGRADAGSGQHGSACGYGGRTARRESVAPELNSETAPDIDGQESAPESYALIPDTLEPKAQTATPEQGLPDALLQLILPGENTGGSCYFGYSADDLALPDSLAVQDDRLLPETLPVYPSAMLEGNVQEERMRAQLAEVLTALGLDAASAETAALTYGSELERGMTPNSVIGWAMAAKLSLTVDACEAAPYGLEIEVTNDGWVWARPAVGNAADAATYASRAEAEAAAADAAVRHAGLIGLAGGKPPGDLLPQRAQLRRHGCRRLAVPVLQCIRRSDRQRTGRDRRLGPAAAGS